MRLAVLLVLLGCDGTYITNSQTIRAGVGATTRAGMMTRVVGTPVAVAGLAAAPVARAAPVREAGAAVCCSR